jgi:hypothetical protein
VVCIGKRGNLKEGHLKDLGIDVRIVVIFCNLVGRAWTGLVWLKIGTTGRLL